MKHTEVHRHIYLYMKEFDFFKIKQFLCILNILLNQFKKSH